MLLIPKDLIDKYFRSKYIYYGERQKYNSDRSINNINSFEYNVYLHNPKYYQELLETCNEIKSYIKKLLETAINLEQTENQIKIEYKYYKLSIKYSYDHNGLQYYESPILKATSILHVYMYLLFNESFENIKLLEAFMGMTDCFTVSKIPDYTEDFCVMLWACDSYHVNDINMFAEYDNVLRNRYDSVAIELELLQYSYDMQNFNNVAFKYPKSETDKVIAKSCIEKTQLKKDVLTQLYKCDTIQPIIQDGLEYYDLLHAFHNFFTYRVMGKLHLEVLSENQVYITI